MPSQPENRTSDPAKRYNVGVTRYSQQCADHMQRKEKIHKNQLIKTQVRERKLRGGFGESLQDASWVRP